MKSPLDDLTASDIQIIKAFAMSDMRISGAANKLGLRLIEGEDDV